MNGDFRTHLLVVAAGSTLALSSAAWAQGQPAAPAAPPATIGSQIEEIIVTTRKREERLQDVPVVVSAFNDNAISDRAAVDLRDLSEAMPNVELQQVGLFQSAAAYFMRGVGVAGIESFADPVVAVFYDGAYQSRNATALGDLFDIETVEVLRGPQGTLYGRNAFAGAIVINSKRPTDRYEAAVEGNFGEYGRADVKVMGNIPIIKGRLHARLAYMHRENDGFFTVGNPSTLPLSTLEALVGTPLRNLIGAHTQGEEKNVFRGSVQFIPNENVEMNIIVTRAINFGDSSPGVNGFFRPINNVTGLPQDSVFTALGFPGRDPFGDFTTGLKGDKSDPFLVGQNHDNINDIKEWTVLGEAKVRTGIGEWYTMVNWNQADELITTDTDGELVDLFASERRQTFESFQAETRLNSKIGDNINLLTGFFVLRDQYDLFQRLLLGFGADPAVPPFRFPTLPTSVMASHGHNGQERFTYAPYFEFDYDVTPQLGITLALRASYEKKKAFNFPNQVASGPSFDIGRDFELLQLSLRCRDTEDSWFALSPRVGADYKPTEGVMFFAFWQRAHKSGGLLNNSASCSPFENEPFDQETVDNYEIGVKSDLFGGRLRLNLNAFYAKYKDLQRTVIRFAPSTPTQQETFTSNAAGARIFGVEAEITAIIIDNLSFNANVGWLNAAYKNFCADLDGPSGYLIANGLPASNCGASNDIGPTADPLRRLALTATDNSGLKLTNAPTWDTNFRVRYDIPLDALGLVSLEGGVSYTSYVETQTQNSLRTDRKPLYRVDAQLAWTDANENYRVAFWGKNLTNEVGRLSRTEVATLFTFEFPTVPRTWGVTVSAKF